MAVMSCKKLLSRAVKGVLFLSLLLLLIAVFIPYLCNRYLLPQLSAQFPFSEQTLEIDSISPWKLKGKLKFSVEKNNVSLSQVEIDYSIPGLLKKEVERVVIDGLAVNLYMDNGRLVLPRSWQMVNYRPLYCLFPMRMRN